jgi:hypothetical protein
MKAGITQVITDNTTPRNAYITDSEVMQTQTVNTQTHSQLLITKATDGTFSNTPVTNRDVMTAQTLNAQKNILTGK